MQDENERYFFVYGLQKSKAWEELAEYHNKFEAVAYAKGYASANMGGFDAIIVKCYAHEDGPYIIWSKYKGE